MSFRETLAEHVRKARPRRKEPPWKQVAISAVCVYAVIHMLQFFDPIMLAIMAATGYLLWRQASAILEVWNNAKPVEEAKNGKGVDSGRKEKPMKQTKKQK